MAAPVDFFCTPGDQHQVRLLVEFLEGLGLQLTLRTASCPDPSEPALVAWTARAERAGWPARLLTGAPGRIALQLDDTGLPLATVPTVDLRRWPARSADAAATTLAAQLLGGAGSGGAMPAAPRSTEPAAAPLPTRDAPEGKDSGRAGGPRRASGTGRRRDWQSGLALALLLGLFAGLGYLITGSEPARDAVAPGDPPVPPLDPGRAPGPATVPVGSGAMDGPAAGAPGGGAAGAAAAVPGTPDHGAAAAARTGAVSGSLAGAGSALEEAAATVQPAAPAPEVPVPPGTDSLAHLCRAVNGDAAYAWALVLDWRQRRAALTEPCVAALAARPAFSELARWLTEQRAAAAQRRGEPPPS